jgi:hypothetical protein
VLTKPFKSFLAASTLALAFVPLDVFAQQKSGATQPAHEILYLAGTHKFVEVNLRSKTAQTWPLLTLAGLENPPECDARRAPTSCDWSASETRLDLKSGRIYFVAPSSRLGDQGTDAQADGPSKFVVWVVSLTDLKPIKTIEVPFSQKSLPTILLSRDGERLLIGYGDEDGKSNDVDTIDTATWAKLNTVKDSTGDVQHTYFSPAAYFAPGDKFVVNNGFRVWLDSSAIRADYIDPRAKLTAEEQKKLSGFLKTTPDGKKYLPVASGASIDGITLETLVNDAVTDSAFWTLNVESGATSPVITPKYFARAELLGHGEEMALFAGRILPPTLTEGYRFERTGHVAIYDVKSGALAREFTLPELKGEGELLCSSTDGTLAAYGRGRSELFLLDLRAGRTTRIAGEFDDLPQPRYRGACEFGE